MRFILSPVRLRLVSIGWVINDFIDYLRKPLFQRGLRPMLRAIVNHDDLLAFKLSIATPSHYNRE